MGVDTSPALIIPVQSVRKKAGIVAACLRFCRRKPLGAIGGIVLLLLVAAAIFAPLIAPYDPFEQRYDKIRVAPGSEFVLGTDNYGRDIFSRIIYGARVSLAVGLGAIVMGTTIGAAIGIASAYTGRQFDIVVQRLMDAMMSFPTLVLALAVVAALGPSITNLIIAIALQQLPRAQRVVRSAALGIREMQFVEAAVATGCRPLRIMTVHIFPGCVAPWLVYATGALAEAILLEATLSFLGLGTPPPQPSWGGMLSGAGRQYLQQAPWMAIYPGIAITMAVFGFNLFGDSLRDVLDPRLRQSEAQCAGG